MTLEVKLRDEIIEAQRIQSELSKWKLILLAGVAATALGSVPGVPAASVSVATRFAVLSLLPFVCLYADELNFHAAARIMTIAKYFRTREDESDTGKPFTAYERWCREHRKHAQAEPNAMFNVSFATSILVFVIGAFADVRKAIGLELAQGGTMLLLIASGIGGVIATAALRRRYDRAMWELNGPDEEYSRPAVPAPLPGTVVPAAAPMPLPVAPPGIVPVVAQPSAVVAGDTPPAPPAAIDPAVVLSAKDDATAQNSH